MAIGDVVNTTARLQQSARVNGIRVGESTYRATRHVIDYAETEPVQAKGKAQSGTFGKRWVPGPLLAWQASI